MRPSVLIAILFCLVLVLILFGVLPVVYPVAAWIFYVLLLVFAGIFLYFILKYGVVLTGAIRSMFRSKEKKKVKKAEDAGHPNDQQNEQPQIKPIEQIEPEPVTLVVEATPVPLTPITPIKTQTSTHYVEENCRIMQDPRLQKHTRAVGMIIQKYKDEDNYRPCHTFQVNYEAKLAAGKTVEEAIQELFYSEFYEETKSLFRNM
jgi:hypothetical protein